MYCTVAVSVIVPVPVAAAPASVSAWSVFEAQQIAPLAATRVQPTSPRSHRPLPRYLQRRFACLSALFLSSWLHRANTPRPRTTTLSSLHSGAAPTAAPPPPYDDTATLKAHALNYTTPVQCPTEPSAAKPRTQAIDLPASLTTRFKKHLARPASTSPPTDVSRKPCQQILRPRSSTAKMKDRRLQDTNEKHLPAHHASRCLNIQS